jgi:hypothetical protein
MLQRLETLKISSDFWFLTRVIRKRGRDTSVTVPSGEGRFAVIGLTLMTSLPNSSRATLMSSDEVLLGKCLITDFTGLSLLV